MKKHKSYLIAAGVLVLLLAGCEQMRVESRQLGGPPATATLAGDVNRSISVSGEAEVRVAPDEVVMTFGVETWDMSIDAAKQQNDEIVKKVIRLAQDHGVESRLIQTDFIQIEPRYRDDYQKKSFIGYFVRKTIAITLRDMSKFEDLFSGALAAGVNYVHGVDFRTTELRKYRDQARDLAIKAAGEKADALARSMGQSLGKVRTIAEDSNQWWSGYSWFGARWGGGSMTQNVVQNAGPGAAGGDAALAPGQISVVARVSLSFDLE